MVFSSTIFLFLFLPVVLVLSFIFRARGRNLLLLAASLFFYAWGEGFYVLLMLASIILNYIAGLLIHQSRGSRADRFVPALAVVLNLGLLALYKYADFLTDNLNILLIAFDIPAMQLDPVHLPIGISFFTFQAMSYIIDVYRKEAPAQKNPINVALYIAMFPQLIAGPIIRYHDVARQIIGRVVTLDGFAYGCRRFILGLGKKVLIANILGSVADKIFLLPAENLDAGIAWLGIVSYTLQIYFDFSGYSDMAIGLGRMFGFRFLENFNYPYISRSIREFWRRWHISLSNWFRDYLYIPLGGNRRGPWRVYANLLIVFFLCGLWHGSSWNFVIWGFLHGAFLTLERMWGDRLLRNLFSPVRHIYVMSVVMPGWVLFRADDLAHALSYLQAMAGLGGGGLDCHIAMYVNSEVILALAAGVLGSTPLIPRLNEMIEKWCSGARYETALGRLQSGVQVGMIGMVMLVSFMFLAAGTYNPFIYFRF